MSKVYIDCACGSTEHVLAFQHDEADNDLYIEVHLSPYLSFWKRIILAVKYVFGLKTNYGCFGCWMLKDKQDADKIIEILERYKAYKPKKRRK